MSDHHDAQDYKANGPTKVGFRTGGDGTGIKKGVVASGNVYGVHGIGLGTVGSSTATIGVFGESPTGYGVLGTSDNWEGVRGNSQLSNGVKGSGKIGVFGEASNASDVSGVGVKGESASGVGVSGHSKRGRGGSFESDSGSAQLRLVPQGVGARLSRRGQPGDLFVRMVQVPTQQDEAKREIAELWFCREVGADERPIWYPVQFGTPQTA